MQGTSIGVISTLLRPFVCRCVARMLDLPDAFPAKRSGDSIDMRPLIPPSMYYDVGWRAWIHGTIDVVAALVKLITLCLWCNIMLRRIKLNVNCYTPLTVLSLNRFHLHRKTTTVLSSTICKPFHYCCAYAWIYGMWQLKILLKCCGIATNLNMIMDMTQRFQRTWTHVDIHYMLSPVSLSPVCL